MATTEGYQEVTTYHFTALGDLFMITEWDENEILFEEVRKNGQEDCHFYGRLRRWAGEWTLDDESVRDLENYYGPAYIGSIESHINYYGVPNGTNGTTEGA